MTVPAAPPRATARARSLRRDSTDAERLLWRRLRDRQLAGAKFRRQHPIGPYSADLCCVEHHLVVEVDGGQHTDQQLQDDERTRYLAARGFRVLRFWNHEVLQQTDAALEQLRLWVEKKRPSVLSLGSAPRSFAGHRAPQWAKRCFAHPLLLRRRARGFNRLVCWIGG